MRTRIAVLLIAALATIGAGTAFAQMDISPGIKAGINIANIYGDDVGDTSTKIGFVVGGFITLGINEIFSIQPEILYTQKGAKADETIDFGAGPVDVEVTTKLDYIEIPVLARLGFPSEGNLDPFFYAGPALGIKASAKATVEIDGDEEEDDLDDVKDMDFGLAVGGGVEIAMGETGSAIQLEGRYTLGLTSVDDSEDEFDVKNGVITFMAGYVFM